MARNIDDIKNRAEQIAKENATMKAETKKNDKATTPKADGVVKAISTKEEIHLFPDFFPGYDEMVKIFMGWSVKSEIRTPEEGEPYGVAVISFHFRNPVFEDLFPTPPYVNIYTGKFGPYQAQNNKYDFTNAEGKEIKGANAHLNGFVDKHPVHNQVALYVKALLKSKNNYIVVPSVK